MAARKTETAEVLEAFSANPAAFKEGYEKIARGIADLSDFNKATVEALMASAGTLARGVEKATSENTAFLKSSYEEGVAAMKAAAASKSAQEALEIQSEFVRASLTRNLEVVTRMSEHWVSTGREAAEPLTRRYGEFVDLVQSYRP